ncbi:hypothetical protein [Curtobacterium sp. Csp1]|uniref:hypothetical protein n=1 Tax=Curtobacterium sp. Csp1 TaxID=2495429 RepID=UPI0020C5EEF2|nr:hypothetical protein [Curtobacterium sp. Csp1]
MLVEGLAADALLVVGRGGVAEPERAVAAAVLADLHDQERQIDRTVGDEGHEVGHGPDADRLGTVQVAGEHLAEHELAVVDEHVPGDRVAPWARRDSSTARSFSAACRRGSSTLPDTSA